MYIRACVYTHADTKRYTCVHVGSKTCTRLHAGSKTPTQTDTGTRERRPVCTCRLKDTCISAGTDTVTDACPPFLFPTKPKLVALGTLTLKNWSSTDITSRFPQTPGGGPHELSFPSLDFSLEISQISLMGAQPPNSWSPWSSVRSEVLL